jgi:hypothetical protein
MVVLKMMAKRRIDGAALVFMQPTLHIANGGNSATPHGSGEAGSTTTFPYPRADLLEPRRPTPAQLRIVVLISWCAPRRLPALAGLGWPSSGKRVD